MYFHAQILTAIYLTGNKISTPYCQRNYAGKNGCHLGCENGLSVSFEDWWQISVVKWVQNALQRTYDLVYMRCPQCICIHRSILSPTLFLRITLIMLEFSKQLKGVSTFLFDSHNQTSTSCFRRPSVDEDWLSRISTMFLSANEPPPVATFTNMI